MTEATLTILGVGHGLCAALVDKFGVVLFDVAPGAVPKTFLRQLRPDQSAQQKIDAILISHLHRDHCAGVTGFCNDSYPVDAIFMNGPRRDSETVDFNRICDVVAAARERTGRPMVWSFDEDAERDVLQRGPVSIRLLAPDAVDARRTRHRISGNRITSHSGCGVARVDYHGHPAVLLTGDLNGEGLDAIEERRLHELRADVLVYPHHGGSSDDSDQRAFAARLADIVRPKVVAFSISRLSQHARPFAEVVAGLREVLGDGVYLACTELSRNCDHRDGRGAGRHDPLIRGGSCSDHCCGGSMQFKLAKPTCGFVGSTSHRRFVDALIPSYAPMCRAAEVVE